MAIRQSDLSTNGNVGALNNPLEATLASLKGTKSNAETIAYCNGLFEKAKNDRLKFERQWFVNLAFYFGRHYVQWVGGTPDIQNFSKLYEPKAPPWRVRMIINKSRMALRKELSKVTKEKPRGYTIPASTEDEDLAAARAGDALYEFFWRTLHLTTVERRCMFWTILCGTGFTKDWYEPETVDASGVKGAIRCEHVSPFHIYVADLQEEDLENQSFVIHSLVKDVDWVKKVYNVDVRPETNGVGQSPDDLQKAALGVSDSNSSGRVAVKEAWIKPNGRYPNGCVVAWAGDQLLFKRDDWPYTHGEYPFAKFDHIPTGRFYGDSIMIDLIPLQKELNRTRSQLVEAKNRMSKPQLVAPRGSIDPNRMTSEPGLVILYTPGYNPPTPLPLTPIPSYVTQEVERIEKDFADISAQHEVSHGGVPPGVSAATAISYLQEADDTSLAPTIASLEAGVEKIGRHLLSHVTQFWLAERTVQVVGKNNQYEAYKFTQANLRGNTDFHIESGSATPVSRAAKQAFLMELGDKGWLTPDRVLKYLDQSDSASMYEEMQISNRQAQRENMQMMEGMEVPVHTFDDDLIHIAEHRVKMRSQDYENAEQHIKDFMEAHVEGHKAKIAAEMQIPYIPGSPVIDGLIKDIETQGQYLAGAMQTRQLMLMQAQPAQEEEKEGQPQGQSQGEK